nr:hypothetical protein [Dyella sp. ASV24]
MHGLDKTKVALLLVRFSELGELEQRSFLDGMSLYLFGSDVERHRAVDDWLGILRLPSTDQGHA